MAKSESDDSFRKRIQIKMDRNLTAKPVDLLKFKGIQLDKMGTSYGLKRESINF